MSKVLRVEVVELAGPLGSIHGDLAGLSHPRGVVAAALKDGDLDLASYDAALHEDLGIDGAGRLDGIGQVLGALDLADAQGRSGAAGLDEQGVAQGLAGGEDRLGIALPGMGADATCGAVAIPAAPRSTLVTCLSMPAALASTPQPT